MLEVVSAYAVEFKLITILNPIIQSPMVKLASCRTQVDRSLMDVEVQSSNYIALLGLIEVRRIAEGEKSKHKSSRSCSQMSQRNPQRFPASVFKIFFIVIITTRYSE